MSIRTRSLLVYVPGMPRDVAAMLPQRALAALAGCLHHEGHDTEILDFGTVSGLGRLGGPGLRAASQLLWEKGDTEAQPLPERGWRRWLGLQEATPLERLGHEAGERHAAEIAEAIASHVVLDFVVFLVQTRGDLRAALPVARRLAESRPEVYRVAAGAYMDEFGAMVLAEDSVFHCACVGDIEAAIVPLAERITRPERWHAVPNLLYTNDGKMTRTPRDLGGGLEHFPAPIYDPALYKAMAGNEKFKVFTLEQSRGSHHVTHDRAEMPWSARQVRIVAAEALGREVNRLSEKFGARAFHFMGETAPAMQIDRLGAEMMARPEPVFYSRESHLAYLQPESCRVLAASGCVAMGFRLDTGSQRLLEDFYGHNFGVTQAETVLRAARAAGIFTTVRLTYPCPMDDLHTVEETLRILGRTQPHAAVLTPCSLRPGSVWRNRAPEFGFRLAGKSHLRWAACNADRGVWTSNGWNGLPYRMEHWTPAQLQESLDYLLEGTRKLGIRPGATEHWGLLARVAGYDGREPFFVEEAGRALFACDAAGLAPFVHAFNAQAAVPVSTMVFRPFAPIRMAVGN